MADSRPKTPIQAAHRRASSWSLLLCAASGCAALVYQVVWFQLLSLVIGASALSLGVLLATFLGGMGLGSLLLPQLVAARHHPLKVYALIEIGIGALGLAAWFAIPVVGRIYTGWASSDGAGLMLRLLAAAVCLLPATILMGATLPAVARWARTLPHGVAWLGACYAANVVGAMLGSVAAAFYLLRQYDAYVATLVAVGLNVAAAAAGLVLASATRLVAVEPEPGANSGLPLARWPVYAVTALSGMTALAAEVLWTRHLSLLLGGTVYTFALILAVLLFGLGVGSGAGAAMGRRVEPRLALAGCQLALGAAIAWGAYVIGRSLPYWPIDVTLPATAEVALQLDLLRTAWAVLPAALLWGASFPLGLAAAAEPGVDARRLMGRLYAANTGGAIAGALLTTFVLVVAMGSRRAEQLSIVVAAGSGILLLVAYAERAGLRKGLRFGAGVALVLAVLAALVHSVPALPPALVAYGRFLPTRGADANVVFVGEGLTSSIAVTQEPNGRLTYHNAGKTQASTYPQDLRLQRMLGHLSTLVPEHPTKVLVIGLGAGMTAGAVSIDPAVEHVVVAEIESLVPKVAAQYFGDYNFDVVRNPKVEIRVDDGRHLLATTDETFDAITSDPLDPWVKGAAALYTREFWQLCRARLNVGGVVTVFVQFYESSEEAVRSQIATFVDVFPNAALFANLVDGMGYDGVLFGSADDAPIDVDRLVQRLDDAAYARVTASLRQAGFESALDLLGTYAAQAADMAPLLASATLNTDRNLRLQYLAAGGLNTYRAAEILDQLTPAEQRFPEHLFAGSAPRLEGLRQRFRAQRGGY